MIVWEYVVNTANAPDFEQAYGPTGAWALLFGRHPGYLGTELLRGSDDRYVTIDRWDSSRSFEEFFASWRREYEQLDADLGPLSETERLVVRGMPVS